jgi:hypothetical protein
MVFRRFMPFRRFSGSCGMTSNILGSYKTENEAETMAGALNALKAK